MGNDINSGNHYDKLIKSNILHIFLLIKKVKSNKNSFRKIRKGQKNNKKL